MAFTRKRLAFQFELVDGNFAKGGNKLDVTNLRASVAIQQQGPPDSGKCAAAIYGLTMDHMNSLTVLTTDLAAVGKNNITVQAFEEGDNTGKVAYKGTIMQAYADLRAQPGACFRVESLVGLYEATAPCTPTTVGGSQDVAGLMKQIAGKAGLMFTNNGVNVKIRDPYLWSSARQQIAELADMAGINWLIENDALVIWNKGKPRDGESVKISPKTGMRGYPTFTAAGVEVVTAFNSKLVYGGQIEIESDLTPACGKWYIFNVEHELDADLPHGKWFTIVSASRVKV